MGSPCSTGSQSRLTWESSDVVSGALQKGRVVGKRHGERASDAAIYRYRTPTGLASTATTTHPLVLPEWRFRSYVCFLLLHCGNSWVLLNSYRLASTEVHRYHYNHTPACSTIRFVCMLSLTCRVAVYYYNLLVPPLSLSPDECGMRGSILRFLIGPAAT
jgi:hypothetical protein